MPVVRFEAPFWCLVVRYSGARFWSGRCVLVVHFGDRFWCRWSVLGLHFSGPRFWTSSGFGGLLWLPGARFWTSVGFPVLVFGPPLASGARFWTSSCGFVLGPSRPTISESPYICFKSSSHPLFASLAFVFPFSPPSFSFPKSMVKYTQAAEVTGSPCMICPEGTWSSEGNDLCERCSLAFRGPWRSTTEMRMLLVFVLGNDWCRKPGCKWVWGGGEARGKPNSLHGTFIVYAGFVFLWYPKHNCRFSAFEVQLALGMTNVGGAARSNASTVPAVPGVAKWVPSLLRWEPLWAACSCYLPNLNITGLPKVSTWLLEQQDFGCHHRFWFYRL